MNYFKKILSALTLTLIFIQQSFAFHHTKWVNVLENENLNKKGITNIQLDADSVNIHNDSIYYALMYWYKKDKQSLPKGYVSIIQNKNNKVGIVETYDYEKYENIMADHVKYSHPAYVAKESRNLKTIDNESFIYNANELAKDYVEIKKYDSSSANLFNGLYKQ